MGDGEEKESGVLHIPDADCSWRKKNLTLSYIIALGPMLKKACPCRDPFC
jgi:hypothetical protein